MVAYIKITVYKLLSLNFQSTLKVPRYEKKITYSNTTWCTAF